MNKQMDKSIKKYLNEIKANIICDFRTKRKFISDMKASVYDFADNANVTSMDEIYNQFGTPQEIAKEFFMNSDIKKIKRRMNFTGALMIGMLIALLMFAITLAAAFLDIYRSNRGYIVDEYSPTIYSQDIEDFV